MDKYWSTLQRGDKRELSLIVCVPDILDTYNVINFNFLFYVLVWGCFFFLFLLFGVMILNSQFVFKDLYYKKKIDWNVEGR